MKEPGEAEDKREEEMKEVVMKGKGRERSREVSEREEKERAGGHG